MNIILASNSPRRKELLKSIGVNFTVIPSNYEEPKITLPPEEYAVFLAFNKANSVFSTHGGIVLGADTIVVYNDMILGKPKDEFDAVNTLKLLSGKTHKVITGYAIISNNKIIKDYCVTKVTFNELSNQTINAYVKTKSPLDKAGAYGIQDGFDLVKEINGDYDNVVGLPTKDIENHLRSFYET